MFRKYAIKRGQFEALLNVLAAGKSVSGAQEIARRFYSGEVEVEWSDDGESAVIRRAIRSLFDQHGIRITKGLKAASCPPNRSFSVERIEFSAIDFAERLGRLKGLGLLPKISAAEFQSRANEIDVFIKADETLVGILKGPGFPLVIPATKVLDLGQITEQFVEAAGTAYGRQFSNRPFTNYRKGELVNKVTVVKDSRYEQLITRLDQDLVAMWFPTALHGLSVYAQREQMASLPQGCVLSGPIDTSIGWIMYPDKVAKSWATPGYDCSAIQWQSSGCSLRFKACDGHAVFDSGTNLSDAHDDYSGGLLLFR